MTDVSVDFQPPCWCLFGWAPTWRLHKHGVSINLDDSRDLILGEVVYSGAPAARRAAKRSPIVITGKKRKPMKDFLMVIMASGIARGRVRTTTTTTTESRNMAAILQKIGWQRHTALVYRVLLWYWTSGAMINWHLSKQVICWPVSRDYIAGSSLQLTEVTCFCKVDRWPSVDFPIGSRAHVRLTCWKQGKIVLGRIKD